MKSWGMVPLEVSTAREYLATIFDAPLNPVQTTPLVVNLGDNTAEIGQSRVREEEAGEIRSSKRSKQWTTRRK